MGIRGYRSLLQNKFKSSQKSLNYINYDFCFIDGNCILHDIIDNTRIINIDNYLTSIKNTFDEYINKINCTFFYITFDGIPPNNKQYTQKKRRLNDYTLKSLLLPNTYILNEIENFLIQSYKENKNIKFDSHTNIGEGEQKIIKNIKSLNCKNKNILIVSHDSDAVLLSQLYLINDNNNINIDVYFPAIDMNINVKSVNKTIFKKQITTDKLLLFCFVCGNDFVNKNIIYKDNTIYEIYNNFKNLNSLNDFKQCTHNCNKKIKKQKILRYSNLFNWYKLYFVTNDIISCRPLNIDHDTPCCYCLNNYIKNKLILTENNINDHLKYVLNDKMYFLL